MAKRNPFETAARDRKVTKMIAVLAAIGPLPTAVDVAAWPDTTWSLLERCAGVTECSPTTRELLAERVGEVAA